MEHTPQLRSSPSFQLPTLTHHQTSLVAQKVKTPPAMQETRVQSLGWKDPLEKEMATHFSILAWKIPWTRESGGLQSTGLQRIRHNRATFTNAHSPLARSPRARGPTGTAYTDKPAEEQSRMENGSGRENGKYATQKVTVNIKVNGRIQAILGCRIPMRCRCIFYREQRREKY